MEYTDHYHLKVELGIFLDMMQKEVHSTPYKNPLQNFFKEKYSI